MNDSILDSICPGPVDSKVYDCDDLDDPISKQYSELIRRFSILNPFRITQAGIMLSYLDIGLAMHMISTPITYYLINTLNVPAKSFSAYITLKKLPWSFKFLFGMISDQIPIFSYRRKSWLFIAWISFIFINLRLYIIQTPSFMDISISMFLMTSAYILAYVCTDTLVVERAKFEPEFVKGTLQTSGMTILTFGMFMGSILGATIYNASVWGWGLTISSLFLLNASIPLTSFIPSWWFIEEISANKTIPSLSQTFRNMWKTLELKAVWWPMIFIYTYYIYQIPNGAWTNFLILGLGFDDFDLGTLSVFSAALYWLGLVVYKTFLFDTSWRKIYIFTTVVGATFSLMQIMLILRINKMIGIPDLYFALGDTAITSFMYAIQSMPSSIMFVMLVPEGSEGVTFALLNTISNLAWTVANDIGSGMTLIWDVSNSAFEAKDFSGMLKLEVLTSLLQLTPLFLVWMLPDSREEQRKLRDSGIRSWYGGLTLTLIIIISFLTTVGVNLYFIL